MLHHARTTAHNQHSLGVLGTPLGKFIVILDAQTFVLQRADNTIERQQAIAHPRHYLLLRQRVSTRKHIGQTRAPAISFVQFREAAHYLAQHVEIDLQTLLIEERQQQFKLQITRTATHSEHRRIDPLGTTLDSRQRVDQRQFKVVMSVETDRHCRALAHHSKRATHILGCHTAERIDHIDAVDPAVELR